MTQSTQRFKGATKEIEDYIFMVSDRCANAKQYTDNIKQLKIYAFQHCTSDVGALFWKNPTNPTFAKPTALTEAQKKDKTELELYKLALKKYVEMSRKIRQETKKLYGVVLGQCTEAVINKLKALDKYEKMNDEEDCAKLLTKIRNITYLSSPASSSSTTTPGTITSTGTSNSGTHRESCSPIGTDT